MATKVWVAGSAPTRTVSKIAKMDKMLPRRATQKTRQFPRRMGHGKEVAKLDKCSKMLPEHLLAKVRHVCGAKFDQIGRHLSEGGD